MKELATQLLASVHLSLGQRWFWFWHWAQLFIISSFEVQLVVLLAPINKLLFKSKPYSSAFYRGYHVQKWHLFPVPCGRKQAESVCSTFCIIECFVFPPSISLSIVGLCLWTIHHDSCRSFLLLSDPRKVNPADGGLFHSPLETGAKLYSHRLTFVEICGSLFRSVYLTAFDGMRYWRILEHFASQKMPMTCHRTMPQSNWKVHAWHLCAIFWQQPVPSTPLQSALERFVGI